MRFVAYVHGSTCFNCLPAAYCSLLSSSYGPRTTRSRAAQQSAPRNPFRAVPSQPHISLGSTNRRSVMPRVDIVLAGAQSTCALVIADESQIEAATVEHQPLADGLSEAPGPRVPLFSDEQAPWRISKSTGDTVTANGKSPLWRGHAFSVQSEDQYLREPIHRRQRIQA